jgi:hypothetical protein
MMTNTPAKIISPGSRQGYVFLCDRRERRNAGLQMASEEHIHGDVQLRLDGKEPHIRPLCLLPIYRRT